MLDSLPTPYPEEWWYSVASRFYLRSGLSQTAAMKELYGPTIGPQMCHGRLFPSSNIRAVIDQLPAGVLTLDTLLFQHTLFPYYMRFHTADDKHRILEAFHRGELLRQDGYSWYRNAKMVFPKYCPKCYQEDMKQYGEPYWHTEHQLPLMSCCRKHHCKLVSTKDAVQHHWAFYCVPLSSIQCQKPDYSLRDWEIPMANLLFEFLSFDYEVGPTDGYHNLVWKLYAEGYENPPFLGGGLNTVQLYEQCVQTFGEESVTQYNFERLAKSSLDVKLWRAWAPDTYALLCVLAHLTGNELFGEDISHGDRLYRQLVSIWESKKKMNDEEVAGMLNISLGQLELITQRYHIHPFWCQIGKSQRRAPARKVIIYLTDQEWQQTSEACQERGYPTLTRFMKDVVLREVCIQNGSD